MLLSVHIAQVFGDRSVLSLSDVVGCFRVISDRHCRCNWRPFPVCKRPVFLNKHSTMKRACSNGLWHTCLVADKASLAAKVCTIPVMGKCPSSVGRIQCPNADGRNCCCKSNTCNRRQVGLRRKHSETSNPTADKNFEEDVKERHGDRHWPNCGKLAGTGLLVNRTSCRKANMYLSSVRPSRMLSLACSVFYTQTFANNKNNDGEIKAMMTN